MPSDRLFRVEPLRGRPIPTSHWLLVGRASAALETHPDELLRVPLDEQANLFALQTNEGVEPEERLEQARSIIDWWPADLLLEAARIEVPWHLLYEPTRWQTRRAGRPAISHEEVWRYLGTYRESRGAWPRIGVLRQRFGRRDNHPRRPPEGQGELRLDQ